MCPGCENLITEQVYPFLKDKTLAKIVDMDFVPYGNAQVITKDPPTFECQHGEKECYANIVELCAIDQDSVKAWHFIFCEETRLDFTEDGIAQCAETSYLDPGLIMDCARDGTGALLHLEAAKKTPEHSYVPWLVVDGQHIDTEKITFKKAVCDAYQGEKPRACME